MSVSEDFPRGIPLQSQLTNLQERVAAAAMIALYLDFDGTLAPIVPRPQDAWMDKDIRAALVKLQARSDFFLAFVSGRGLDDLRRRVGLDDVVFAGNHGLEIEGKGVKFVEPHAEKLQQDRRCIIEHLEKELPKIENVEIEDKGLSASVHFRGVPEELHDHVREIVYAAISCAPSFQGISGKMVVEIRPRVNWNKGYAVSWISEHLVQANALAISIGDDTTDEDAFAALPDGITIRVGSFEATHARYSVPDLTAVRDFLIWLEQTRLNASTSSPHHVSQRPPLV